MKCYQCEYYAKKCCVTAELPACQDFTPRKAKARGKVANSIEYYAARKAGLRTDIVAGNYIIYK